VRIKKTISILLLLILFFIFLPFGTLFLGSKIRNFYFREVFFSLLSDKIDTKESTDDSNAYKIYQFVCNNIIKPNNNTIPNDSNPFEVLVTGKGSCDQQSNLIITLGGFLRIKGYLIYLYIPKSNVSSHTICLLKTRKNIFIFDPFYKKKYDSEIFSKMKIKKHELFYLRKTNLKNNNNLMYDRCKLINDNNVSFMRKVIRKYTHSWIIFFNKTLFKKYMNAFFLIDKTNFAEKKKIYFYLNLK
jgi:hypothetical protein